MKHYYFRCLVNGELYDDVQSVECCVDPDKYLVDFIRQAELEESCVGSKDSKGSWRFISAEELQNPYFAVCLKVD